MTQLAELARLIRSKNAGPFELTFDIMFDEAETYERVKRSGKLSREVVAAIYSLPVSDVKFFFCDHARAIKATIPRPYFQGDPLDSDSHGGQQYAAAHGHRNPLRLCCSATRPSARAARPAGD